MPGFDDPRYVEQQFKALLKRLDKVEQQALPFATNQRGPLPGQMRAVAINDPNTKGAMWMNFGNLGPGLGPYTAVTDPNGTIRAEFGNLAANGNSPAQYGFRALTAAGVPIFDSLGLIAVANLLATDNPGSGTSAGSGTGFGTVQTIPGSGTNFTLARTGNILCFSNLSGDMTAGAVNYCALYFGIWQSGVLVTRQRVSAFGTLQNNNYFMTPIAVFTGLAGGTYQFRQEFALDAATTAVGFGTGSTGQGPIAFVLQLGS